MSTLDIDEDVEAYIHREGAAPAFKGYRGFPATVCVSINEEVVHGIPSPGARSMRATSSASTSGGIVEGTTRTARSLFRSARCRRTCRSCWNVTRESLDRGHPGVPARAAAVGRVAPPSSRTSEAHGFSIVRAFVGHGIGRGAARKSPRSPTFGDPGRGPQLRAGMVLAIEPMVTMGSWEGQDSWTMAGRR